MVVCHTKKLVSEDKSKGKKTLLLKRHLKSQNTSSHPTKTSTMTLLTKGLKIHLLLHLLLFLLTELNYKESSLVWVG